MKVTAKVSGFKELDAVLKELPRTMQKQVLGNAVAAGARAIRKEVKGAIPVGQDPSPASKKYGSAKSNVRFFRLRRLRRAVAGYRVSMGKAFWMTFYEFGTSRQPARPFFRPAFERASGEAIKAMRDRLAVGLEKAAKQLAGRYGSIRKRLLRG